jgi:S1-C subfamily serine protease
VRLYSRWQVALISGAAVVVVLAVATAAGLLRIPGRGGGSAASNLAQDDAAGMELEIPDTQLPGAGGTPEILGQSVQFSGTFSADEANNIQIYERLNTGVVNITSVTFEYNWFLEPQPREGTGSGSIIDSKGHVLTNYHVIKDAEELSVTLADGENFKGTIVGVDRENDLAVVEFDPKGKELTVIPLGRSEDLRVGQKVLAIGNPFALDRTLTTGIVSGLGRPVRSDSGIVIREMIQTDASINPGNSGGPLLNPRGEMIGINTMIYSPSGGSVGIGFAVPVDTARRVLPDLLRYGKVQRGWIDIEPVQLFPALVRYADLPVSEGILVSEVAPGSNADKAGLKGGDQPVRYGRSTFRIGGDIILEVDHAPVATFADLLGALEDNKPGETVVVKVLRGRRQQELTVKLSERPQALRW